MNSGLKIGIGIVTYNRHDIVRNTVEHVRNMTETDVILVVADDGSHDETVPMLKSIGIPTIRGSNRGIAWNKNRILYYLHEIQHCDIIILLEDDTYPTEKGWEKQWIDAALRWGHINLAPSHWPDGCVINGNPVFLAGAGTSESPFICSVVTGQCEVFSSVALTCCGYLDTRFKGYGYEHAEHTLRLIRSGFGGVMRRNDEQSLLPYLIRSPLAVTCLDKTPPADEITRNAPVFEAMKHDPLHRWCWRNDEDMAILLSEMVTVPAPGGLSVARGWLLRGTGGVYLTWNEQQKRLFGEMTCHNVDQRLVAHVSGRSARFALHKDGARKHWVNLHANGHAELTKEVGDSTEFEIISSRGEGFGFRYGGKYLCCDAGQNNEVSCSRDRMAGWETFRFDGFTT